MTLPAGAGQGVAVVNLVLPRKRKECCLTANVCGAWLGRAFFWSRSLAGGGGGDSTRAWVYQSKGIGMKGWEKTFQGCRRGSGAADDVLFFTVCIA